MLPDFDRADAIGSYWGNPKTRTFAELLINSEEDRVLRAVLVGMLREEERAHWAHHEPAPHAEPAVESKESTHRFTRRTSGIEPA